MADNLARLARARELITQGVSRRKADVILRAEFGKSIGHGTHSRVYKGVKRLPPPRKPKIREATGYKAPLTQREKRYNKWLAGHFLAAEAVEFVKLRRMDSREVKALFEIRADLWKRFVSYAKSHYSPRQVTQKWYEWVVRWYHDKQLVTGLPGTKFAVERTKRKPSVWEWYNAVRKQIPPELQADSPRRHKKIRQHIKGGFIRRAQESRIINDLKAELDKEQSPERRAYLRAKIAELQSEARK